MVTLGTAVTESKLGFRAKKLRVASRLTRAILAEMAGVSKEEISLFERGLPVCLDSRRRILKALWTKKAGK